MPSKKTTAGLGASGAIAMLRHPTLRRATVRVGAPTAKVGWRVGKVVAKRKVRGQLERIGAAGRTVSAIWVVYGPPAAEALGLIEKPKPKRRAPAFAAGAVIGATAVYLLLRQGRDELGGPGPADGDAFGPAAPIPEGVSTSDGT